MAMQSLSMFGLSRLLSACFSAAVLVSVADFVKAAEPASNYEQQTGAKAELPADVIDAVWKAIDANQDGRATDREAYDAIKPVRVAANSKKESSLRDALRKAGDADESGLLTQAEALSVIARVRGAKCPTAQNAAAYFKRLDANQDQQLDGPEVRGLLAPLGAVGRALFQPVGVTAKYMDLNNDDIISEEEVYLSANAMLRIQLATDGNGIARRDPEDWLKFVNAISAMDIDADNQVSQVEARQVAAIGGQFGRIDRNRNYQISIDELCEYQDALDLTAYLSASVGGS